MQSPNTSFKPHIRGVASSATLEINERSNALRAQGRTVYKLGLGQSPFPVPDPVVTALRDHAAEKDYLPVRGLPLLRKAVADYHNRMSGTDYGLDDVLIAPGSKELLYILQLVFDGIIVLPSPSWVTYAPQAQLFGNRVRWVETRAADKWKLTPGALEHACREDGQVPKLLVLNYPSNPTGYSFTEDELKELAEVMRTHRIIVLSDEIYGELDHSGGHVSLARYYPEGTIVSAGLSKWCGAGGWRLGTFVFPPRLHELLDIMSVVASETYTATSAPIQHAAVTAFRKGDDIDRYVQGARAVLSSLAGPIVRRLRGAGAQLANPDGAFYLFPSFDSLSGEFVKHGIESSHDFCSRLLDDTGVAVLPGAAFGRPPEELSVRIAYVDFDGARALDKVLRGEPADDRFAHKYCTDVITAVDLMSAWVEDLVSSEG